MKMTWPGMVVAVLTCVAFGFVAAEAPAIAAAVYGYMSVWPGIDFDGNSDVVWVAAWALAAAMALVQVIVSVAMSFGTLQHGFFGAVFHRDNGLFSKNLVLFDIPRAIFFLPAFLMMPVMIAVVFVVPRVFGLLGRLATIRLTTMED